MLEKWVTIGRVPRPAHDDIFVARDEERRIALFICSPVGGVFPDSPCLLLSGDQAEALKNLLEEADSSR